MDEKFEKLRNSLLTRLSSDRVDVCGDELSIKNVMDALTWSLEDYNGILIKGGSIIIDKIKKESKKNKTNLVVENIVFNVLKDGSTNIEIYFAPNRKNKIFKLIIDEKLQPLSIIFINDDSLDTSNIDDFLKINSSRLKAFFDEMNEFIDDYPGIDFSWDVKNNNEVFQTIGDNEFSCDLKLLNVKENRVRFTRQGDFISSETSDKYKDDLYEYLDFYNEEVASKTKVNINDLNEPVKMFVKKYYGLDKSEKLSL